MVATSVDKLILLLVTDLLAQKGDITDIQGFFIYLVPVFFTFNQRYTAHYTVPDWQCLHSGFGHGVRAHQDVLKAAHSSILCILPIRYSSVFSLLSY